MKQVVICLLFAFVTNADIISSFLGTPWDDQYWTSKEITIENTTGNPIYISGIRFDTPEYAWTGTADSKAAMSTLTTGLPNRLQALFANSEVNFKGNDTLKFSVTGSPGGKDGSPSNPSYIVKNGSHYWPLDIPYSDPVKVSEIDSLMSNSDFYDSSLAILDTLGQRGGAKSGGLLDSWYGLTQLHSALPVDPFYQNSTWMTFEPKEYGNALYMMTLAAMQEYFNIDMQVLIAKGGKENMAGMVWWDTDGQGPTVRMGKVYGTGNNGLSSVDFSPFSVEYQTFNDYIYNSYPTYFPLGTSQPQNSNNNDYFSTSASGYCDLDKANVVNGTLIACLYNWYTFQLGLNSSDYGFNELIAEGKDPQGALKLALWAFNRGISVGWEQVVATNEAFSYAKIEEYPKITETAYILGISAALKPIVDAARKSENLSGGDIPIYDDTISISLVEEFLFGIGGVGSTGTKGEGGLLQHFDIATGNLITLWSDVEAAFNKLKGNAPSTKSQTEKISYRYDWLTLMRVIKQYVDFTIPLPTTYKYYSWVTGHSSKAITFGGETKDDTFPRMTEFAKTTIPDNIKVDVTATDNLSIKSVEWTTDSTLKTWSVGTFKSGSIWSVTVPTIPPVGKSAGDNFKYWIRATDDWGNAEIRGFDDKYTKPTSAQKIITKFSNFELTMKLINNKLHLYIPSGITKSNIGVNIFTIQGQHILSKSIKYKANSKLSLSNVASGMYIVQVNFDGYSFCRKIATLK